MEVLVILTGVLKYSTIQALCSLRSHYAFGCLFVSVCLCLFVCEGCWEHETGTVFGSVLHAPTADLCSTRVPLLDAVPGGLSFLGESPIPHPPFCQKLTLESSQKSSGPGW